MTERRTEAQDRDRRTSQAEITLAALFTLLEEAAPVEDRLRRAQDHLADAPDACARLMVPLLGAVSVAQRREQAALSAQMQKAQFLAQHFRPVPDSHSDRLQGNARALNELLTGALTALPRRKRSKFFDAVGYLAANPDVAQADLDPLTHYLKNGAAEGRGPGNLRALCPGIHNDLLPITLTDLLRSARPGFVEEFPAALRIAALSQVKQDNRSVSVIVPSWNRGHMIAHAVASALLQSRPPQEVIVIDDGSTDGTPDVLRAAFPEPLAERRLVLIEAPHCGVAAARNTGLAAAKGEIIAYLDSDNTWEPDHLLFACAGMSLPAEARMAYTALCRHNLRDGWSDILFHPFGRIALEAENFIDLNSFVHDRALFDDLGGFDTGLTRFVDWDLILRYSRSGAPVAVPVITGHYFIAAEGAGSITLDEPAEPNMARIRARLANQAMSGEGLAQDGQQDV